MSFQVTGFATAKWVVQLGIKSSYSRCRVTWSECSKWVFKESCQAPGALWFRKKSYANLRSVTNAAMMPFRLVLPKDDKLRLNLHFERREMTKGNRSDAQHVVLTVEVEADISPEVPRVGLTNAVHCYGRGVTSRGTSARCVPRGFVSATE
eukprot:6179293-Pleurochrysis_carterae.AAC.6